MLQKFIQLNSVRDRGDSTPIIIILILDRVKCIVVSSRTTDVSIDFVRFHRSWQRHRADRFATF